MRIITGTARGTGLVTLEGEDITRPTTEKVKEGIFSAIQFDIEGRKVLDLFAGCGQLGLEALSRGAESAVFVDASDKAVSVIKQNAQKTKLYSQCVILCGGYKEYIKSAKGRSFDIVFIDPPYNSGYGADAVKRLAEGGILSKGALVIWEGDSQDVDYGDGYELRKLYRYGKTYVNILVYKGDDGE